MRFAVEKPGMFGAQEGHLGSVVEDGGSLNSFGIDHHFRLDSCAIDEVNITHRSVVLVI